MSARGEVYLFGIRHHGVGSARSLASALTALQPDCLLIEGPPDADALIPLAADADLQPPIALLVYAVDQPQRAGWYPFADFSPEWIALRHALAHGIAVQFMDLPQKHMLALNPETPVVIDGDADADRRSDPLGTLAALSGESDSERWWSRVVEECDNPADVFALIHEAMAVLRAEQPAPAGREALREAWMRKAIRAAEKQFARIAVVCGAWHVPALANRAGAKDDDALLKGLPTVKTAATFVPWTYTRLSLRSGYGAGIQSPGWYDHLWRTPRGEVAARWLARAAAALRAEGMLASSAQVIDALRLSDMLAVLRGGTIGLDELNEACIAVLCGGHDEPLALLQRQLIVGEQFGAVPPSVPLVPLQRDFLAQGKALRLKLTPDPAPLDLDLRNANDLARSRLFHRLNLLRVHWARPADPTQRNTGTFRESWSIAWTPELDIRLIEASIWGSTVSAAATAQAAHQAAQAGTLAQITPLLHAATLADLPDALAGILRRLDALASVSHDTADLIAAAPPLIDTLRYGDVRGTDAGLIAPILEGLITRACIGLARAVSGIDDDAAAALNPHIAALHSALPLAERADLSARWFDALAEVSDSARAHPLIAGSAVRLRLRANLLTGADAAGYLARAASPGTPPLDAAHWLEGFLVGMETLLVRDAALFDLVDEWIVGLEGDQFIEILPLLRRTFATYNAPARRTLGERVQHGEVRRETTALDESRAARVLPVLATILGIDS